MGNEVVILYMRDTQQSAYEFSPTFAKLLTYDATGKLLSATALPTTISSPFLGGDLITFQAIDYFNGSTIYADASNGKGAGDTLIAIRNGAIIDSTGLDLSDYSPNGRYLVYSPLTPVGVKISGLEDDCGGEDSNAISDIRLIDFETGATTTIAYDLTKGFLPSGWSNDGTKILFIISTGDNGCIATSTNFLVYDVVTKQATINQNLTNVIGALNTVCAQDGFDCSGAASWFQ